MVSDSRVPVAAEALGMPGPAGWVELAAPAATHQAFGCACCVPRGPLARALAGLWLDAARDGRELPGVLVRGTTSDALAALLDGDVVCAARFRLAATP